MNKDKSPPNYGSGNGCTMQDGTIGECCPNDSSWTGICADKTPPHYYGSGCANACCPAGKCPTGPAPAPSPGGDGTCPYDNCDSCTSSSLMSADSIPTIKGISITGSQLIINYEGGSKPPPHKGPKGVNPYPTSYGSKVMWLYACPLKQGLACVPDKYRGNMKGFVDAIIESNVNYISLICNNSFRNPADLGLLVPTEYPKPNTDPSTWKTCSIPEGFTPWAPPTKQTQTPIIFMKEDLKRLHSSGITIVISIGSWMSDFPRDSAGNAGWKDEDYIEYVERFKCIRCALDNSIDGLDFDIEGTCDGAGIWGQGFCGWDKGCSGDGGMKTDGTVPNDSAHAGAIKANGLDSKLGCYILPDQGTVNVLNGIAKEMKNTANGNNFPVTIVPPTNTLFSSKKDEVNGQNQLVKYGLDFNYIDGVMFQFYTGFDAGMCQKGDDRWGNCPQTNYEELSKIEISDLVGKGINDSYKSLPYYPNYPNRNPVHCPRYIDCPDWQYEGEKPFQRQVEYFTDLASLDGLSMEKFIFGLEFFYNTSQWGPFPSASLFYGLDQALQKSKPHGGSLGGVGGWTIAGTFGQYDYPNKAELASGLLRCNRKQYENQGGDVSDVITQGNINGNMNCLGPYFTHFEKAITTCWGAWGRAPNGKGYTKASTVQCSDYVPSGSEKNWCALSSGAGDHPNGMVQCVPIKTSYINPWTQKIEPVITEDVPLEKPAGWPPTDVIQ